MTTFRSPMFRRAVRRPPQDSAGGVPYTIAGLLVDLDADDLRATLADAAAVTTWSDRSGNANHVGNTGSNRPTFDYTNPAFNGHASVNFAKASTQYLFGSDLPICNALSGTGVLWTAFVVYRRSTKVSAQETFLSLGNSGSAVNYQQARWVYASSNSQRPGASCRDAVAADSAFQGLNEIIDLSPQIAVVQRGAAAMTHRVVGLSLNPLYDATVDAINLTSGADYATQGAFTHDRFTIGALVRSTVSSPCDVEVACILIYVGELTQPVVSRISEHLWNKYAQRVITAPGEISGLAHHWDASLLSEAAAAAVSTFAASTGGKDFTGAGGTRPVVALHENGRKVLRFDGTDDTMAAGVAADWTFLHNDTEYSAFVVYRAYDAADAALSPLLDTVNNDTVNVRGIGIYHDAASDAQRLQIKIGALNATAVLNFASQNYGARPGTFHVAHLTHEVTANLPSSEEEYHVWIDNEHFASTDRGVAQSGTDSANTLTLGALAGGVTFGKVDIAEIIIYTRKLGPWESQLVHEYLARKWQTSHVAVVAGNGLADILSQTTTKHRGFPGLAKTSQGHWLCCWRRASAHGASTGVLCCATSADGIRWSDERVIFDDSANYDYRGVYFLGEIDGRLFVGGRFAEKDTSALIPYKTHLMYSDDGGGTWSAPVYLSNATDNWFVGLFNGTLDHDEGLNSIVKCGDGSLLAHFCAKVDGGVYRHLVQCRSLDGGLTWSEPEVVYYGRSTGAGGDFPADEDIQEPVCIKFPDGELLLAIRAETTNNRVYFARSTDHGVTWSPGTFSTEFIAAWGNPRMALDANERATLWVRNAGGLLPNWTVSDDRGATWTALRRFANLTSTTTIQGYTQLDYGYAAQDEDGNTWLAYSLNRNGDGDIFVTRWENAAA